MEIHAKIILFPFCTPYIRPIYIGHTLTFTHIAALRTNDVTKPGHDREYLIPT